MSLYTDKSNILMCQDQSEAFLERSKDSISKLEEQQTGMVYVTCKPGSQGRLLVQGRASANAVEPAYSVVPKKDAGLPALSGEGHALQPPRSMMQTDGDPAFRCPLCHRLRQKFAGFTSRCTCMHTDGMLSHLLDI